MEPLHTILVVDEVPFFRDFARQVLAGTGQVLTCDDGSEALALARARQPDLIVLDLGLPGMDGAEVCRAIRRDPEISRTPVIVVSGSDLAEDRARALRAGADDVLCKPLSRVTLAEGVERFFHTPKPRGLPRVTFATPLPVSIRCGEQQTWGRICNLSRSGMFVETDALLPPRAEMDVAFCIPEAGLEFTPSARVVWNRTTAGQEVGGMGLAFLALDRQSAARLDEYVSERVGIHEPAPLESVAV